MTAHTLIQLTVIVSYVSLRYLLLGYSFALLYRSVGYVDFAFGTAFTIAPMAAVLFGQALGNAGFGLLIGIVCAPLLLAPILGWVAHVSGGPPGARTPENTFISSLGIFLIVGSAVSLLAGDAAVPFYFSSLRTPTLGISVVFTSAQLLSTVVSVIGLLSLWLVLSRTAIGLKIRALQESEATLEEWGERVAVIRGCAFALSYFFAGVAGILLALDADPEPRMGMEAILIGVFVALFAQGRSGLALLAGAVLIAAIEQTATYFLGGLWKVIVLFLAIIILLNLRQRGRSLVSLVTGGTQLRV